VDVKALMGDSSDNIPGVPGIGEKTALKLIAEYGSLDGVYDTLPEAKHTPSLRAKLEGGKDSAYLSRTLATICREVPLDSTLNDYAYAGLDRVRTLSLFQKYEFNAFIKRFGLMQAEPNEQAPQIEIGTIDADGIAQLTDTVAFDLCEGNGGFVSGAVAFRYIFVPDLGCEYGFSADYEYLPLENKGSFRSDDPMINKIWEVADYTLHLNAREGFFDGLKRDRWVWGGDAYQSYFVNYYLMNDNDIVRRTQRILRGANPMTMHINTISDYTFYWIAAMWEYYFHTGDKQFIWASYPNMLSTMNFVMGRLDDDGLYAKRKGDWVFVDWTTFFDKDSGPMCAEQMLLCRAYDCMAKCAALLDDEKTEERFTGLKNDLFEKINRLYWDEEKSAFVDDYTTGNRNVTRHANIFALLYDLTSAERKQRIIKHVIKNSEIPAITTPYFEFFELDAMCSIGEFSYMTDMLHSYWGGMINHGATTIWEEYFPEKSRVENYAMYGKPFGKSLCHAWGASPIYLLGKYALGVRPTSPAYETYEVRPNLMCFGAFEGTVPAANGTVWVKMTRESVTVRSDIEGGTLVLGDKTYSIEKDCELTVAIS
jgi:hypothetical protein